MSNYLTTVKGVGSYGECHVVYSKFMVRNGTAPIAIFHHGHWGSADATLDPEVSPGSISVIEYLARNGYVVVVGDFRPLGGVGSATLWGNQDNHNGITEAKEFGILHGGSSSKKVFLLGTSMGVTSVMGYAGRYSPLVAGVLGLVPALDIATYKTPGRYGPFNFDGVTPYSFASTINAAYGGSYNNATHGPTHNPQVQAVNGAFANTKIQLWYGDKDTFASELLIKEFSNAVKNHTPSAPVVVRKIPVDNIIHTDAALLSVPKVEILSFAQSCVT